MYIDTKEVVKALVPKYLSGRVLDIGGGIPTYAAFLNQSVTEYVTCDLYPEAPVDVIADARSLEPIPDASFDGVVCLQVFEHIDDTTAVVSSMHRVLKPGGYALITAPFIIAEHGYPNDYHRFTLEGLSFVLTKAGFTIVESGKQGSTLSVVSELLRFAFLHPLKQHGRLKNRVFHRVFHTLKTLDRKGYAENHDLYANVYAVVQKRGLSPSETAPPMFE